MDSNKIIGIPFLDKSKAYILTICFFLIFFISCDISIISTASTGMMSEIGGEQYYSLLLSLKNTTYTVTGLLCGKLIEKLGRRNIMALGLLIQIVTNFTTGISSSIGPMLVSRTVFGVGGGLTNVAVMIVISEMFGSKAGYGYMITLLGYGFGNVGGPLLAGYLIENYSWRWGFWLLMAIAVIAFILLLLACPNYHIREETSAMDAKGMVLFSISLCMIVTVLSFGGAYLPWNSPVTAIMIIMAISVLVMFIQHEKKLDQVIALLPISMLHSRLLIGCAVGQFTMSLNSTCLYSYLPYYMQEAMGATPTQAGVSTSIISFLTTAVGAILLIVMVRSQQHLKFAVFTVIGEAVALTLIYVFLSPTLSFALLYTLIIFYGLTQSVESYAFTMTAQMGLTTSKIAVGTAIIQFVRNFTGTAATAISTPIINSGASISIGLKNVFLFAAIATIAGAIIFVVCIPSTKKIRD